MEFTKAFSYNCKLSTYFDFRDIIFIGFTSFTNNVILGE